MNSILYESRMRKMSGAGGSNSNDGVLVGGFYSTTAGMVNVRTRNSTGDGAVPLTLVPSAPGSSVKEGR